MAALHENCTQKRNQCTKSLALDTRDPWLDGLCDHDRAHVLDQGFACTCDPSSPAPVVPSSELARDYENTRYSFFCSSGHGP